MKESISRSGVGRSLADVAAQACEQERFERKFLLKYERRCRKAFGADFDVAYHIACLQLP